MLHYNESLPSKINRFFSRNFKIIHMLYDCYLLFEINFVIDQKIHSMHHIVANLLVGTSRLLHGSSARLRTSEAGFCHPVEVSVVRSRSRSGLEESRRGHRPLRVTDLFVMGQCDRVAQ